MSPKTMVIVVLSLILRVSAQDAAKAPTHCRFADGKTINVTYSDHVGTTRLATDESLVTVNGISVPSGNYVISASKDSRNNWSLRMKKVSGSKNGPSQLPPVPMSINTSASPIVGVSFDQTGGSCTMLWAVENSSVLLSVEFTQRNADIPVLQ